MFKYFLLFIAFYIVFIYVFFFIYWSRKLPPAEPSVRGSYKVKPLLVRLFFDFPKQFIYDLKTRNPNKFPLYGLHMICGKQGSGKTMTLVYLLDKYQKQFPKVKVKTNFDYKGESEPINSWQDLTMNTNGEYGEIDCIDEIHSWFSSNMSRDFPPDFLSVVSQQRKVTRVIFGTAQVFSRVAKPLREQTYLLYLPFTVAGCLTVVRVYDFVLDSDDGLIRDKKLRKMFCFVQTPELREKFDTFKVIEKIRSSGFAPTPIIANSSGHSGGVTTVTRRVQNNRKI